MLKAISIDKYFRNGKNKLHVLNKLSYSFPTKGLVSIFGRSGSGKTTFLNVLSGLDSVESGEIDFDEHHFTRYKTKLWDKIRKENIGFVFQNYQLIPSLSVFDNVAYPLQLLGISDKTVIEDRVNYVLTMLGIFKYRKRKANHLSGGQQQRVAIARALVKKPSVIFADEPTGNLDSANTIEVMNIIKSISNDILVVLVTHEESIAKYYSDVILKMNDGVISEIIDNSNFEKKELVNENIVYLQEYSQVEEFTGDHVEAKFYVDKESLEKPIGLRVILRNNTLYIDVNNNKYRKVLVNEESNIQIIDAKKAPKTEAEIMTTSFEWNRLDSTDVKKRRAIFVSFKQALVSCLAKLRGYRAKGKLMLIAFLISGFMCASGTNSLSQIVNLSVGDFLFGSTYNVIIEKSSANLSAAYTDIVNNADYDIYYNDFGRLRLQSYTFGLSAGSYYIDGVLEAAEFVDASDLFMGRLPVANNEIMISREAAVAILREGEAYGMWNYSSLLNERLQNLYYDNLDYTIVGIVNDVYRSGITRINFNNNFQSLIYMNEEGRYKGYSVWQYVEGLDDYFSFSYLNGMPELSYGNINNEGFFFSQNDVSNYFPELQAMILDETAVFPYTDKGITIAGVYNDEAHGGYIYTSLAKMKEIIVNKMTTDYEEDIKISTKEVDKLVEAFKLHGITAVSITAKAQEDLSSMRKITIAASMVNIVLCFSISFVGFFFLIRSSFSSRISDIVVYRYLGTKRSVIFVSFLFETLILTTITTAVGYTAGALINHYLQNSVFGMLGIVSTSSLAFLMGLIGIYAINLLAGLLPVLITLKATPAKLLAKYDI